MDKVIKKYLHKKYHNFPNDRNQSKDLLDVYHLKWSYIGKTLDRINIKLPKICKQSCKKIIKIYVFTSFKTVVPIRTLFLKIWSSSWYINLLALAVMLGVSTKHVVILKLGLRNASKRITNQCFKYFHTAWINFHNHLSFRIIDEGNWWIIKSVVKTFLL